jgi:hypothetical protein
VDQAREARDRGAETAEKAADRRKVGSRERATLTCPDRAHVASLLRRRPARKAAQIRWLWPQIQEALAAGHTIADVRRELALDGLEISYSKLRTHVAQLRKSGRTQTGTASDVSVPVMIEQPISLEPGRASRRQGKGNATTYDPLANLRDRLVRRPGFQYDGMPPDEQKLI